MLNDNVLHNSYLILKFIFKFEKILPLQIEILRMSVVLRRLIQIYCKISPVYIYYGNLKYSREKYQSSN